MGGTDSGGYTTFLDAFALFHFEFSNLLKMIMPIGSTMKSVDEFGLNSLQLIGL